MRIAIPREIVPGETRVAAVPDTVSRLAKKGAEVVVERGLGAHLGWGDDAYEGAGARIVEDRRALLSDADAVLRVRKPSADEVVVLKEDCLHISLLDPFNSADLLGELARCGVDAIAMELMPRSTRAQKMDVLSSQSNLAGYAAAVMAAERLNRIYPMMMTPSGTIAPARVFVIGAGVAGLQAIATAKRLGARVEAFDTRPEVEEQVHSLGARFVKIDLGETGRTEQGYARELTDEQKAKQRAGMAKVCAQSDVVITTAQVFGRRAPLIVTRDMIAGMRPGSVIVDLAVETGGNVEGVEEDHEVDIGGVRVIGLANLPSRVAVNASQMYASNLCNFIEEFWDKEAKNVKLDVNDEIIRSVLVTHDGKVLWEQAGSLARE